MRPELIIAEKEFVDHITSKRFIVIFGILLLLAIYAISTGMDSYNQQLDHYKNAQDDPNSQQNIASLQKSIQDARDHNMSNDYINSLQYQLDKLVNPPMPSVLQVFQGMLLLFSFVGMILGASLGFDQIARERDEGSLKFLVSSPIYRDAIINGKTIGAIATLASAMAAAFAITIAILMLKGVLPGVEEMIRIFLFFLASLLYCTLFFALAMMISTLSKSAAIAAVLTVGVVFSIFTYTVLAAFLSSWIALSIVGPAPSPGIDYGSVPPIIDNRTTNEIVYDVSSTYNSDAYSRYSDQLGTIKAEIGDLIGTISPIDDYIGYMGYGHLGIGPALITKDSSSSYYYSEANGTQDYGKQVSLLDSLSAIWMKVFALILEIGIAFGISYISFMRADVR